MKAERNWLQFIQNKMQTSLTIAESVLEQVQAREDWEADSQKVMAAFLDLLVQYHKDLCNEDSPIDCAIQSIDEFLTCGDTFYDSSVSYKDMESIG